MKIQYYIFENYRICQMNMIYYIYVVIWSAGKMVCFAMLRLWKSTMFGTSPVPSPTNNIIEAKKDC